MTPDALKNLIKSAKEDAQVALNSGTVVDGSIENSTPAEEPLQYVSSVQDTIAKTAHIVRMWGDYLANPDIDPIEQEKLAAYQHRQNLGVAKIFAAIDCIVKGG